MKQNLEIKTINHFFSMHILPFIPMGETCVDNKENVDSLWWDKDFGSLTAFCQSILLSFISFPVIRC